MEVEKDIVYSREIKAGRRIYYLDVKRNRRGELFLVVTESKKVSRGEGLEAKVFFEKHKVFLYKEDFDKFLVGMHDVVDFIKAEQGDCEIPAVEDVHVKEVQSGEPEEPEAAPSESKIDIGEIDLSGFDLDF